jgi:hypothetical protein
MVAKNDITGDSIQTRASSKAFEEGIDRIFDKTKEREEKAKEKADYFARLEAETKARMNQQEFDLESLDPDERSWYYDDFGVKRKKPEVKIKATIPDVKIKGSI